MPRATVLRTTERRDLATLPKTDEEEGGWVELRRLSFGEKLDKDAEAMKMRFDFGKVEDVKDMDAEVSLISAYATVVEFSRCIVDHNLEDDNGKKLDLSKLDSVRQLDPRVGQEISELLGEINDFEKRARSSVKDETGK